MNSERRHELQQNDLAIYLNKINKSIEPYAKLIAIVVGVLIVGAIVYGFYRSEQLGKRSEATLQLIQASQTQDAEVLMTVSNAYPDTVAGDWARLYQGQLLLSQGVQRLYSDREDAQQLLSDAKQALQAAISGSKDKLLQSRAQFGIARAAEALGNLEEAIAEYETVKSINESEAMNKKAQERIDVLSRPDAKEFVSWFADQDFSPADPSLPPSLPGGDTLPDMPDLKLPPLDLGPAVKGGAPRDLEGGLELPSEGAAPPTETEAKQEASEIVLPEGADPAAATPAPETETKQAEPSGEQATPTVEAPASEEPSAEPADQPAPDSNDGVDE